MAKYPKLLEEIFNSITHGIGFILFLIGFISYFFLREKTTIWNVIGVCIFTISLLFLYSMSTLSHSLIFTKAKRVFLTLDGAAIFFLIAGTYTPLLLIALRGVFGWILLALVWSVAIAGMTVYAIFFERIKTITVIVYLLLGWLIVIAIKPLHNALSPNIITLLVTGGVLYTTGMIFYNWKKLPFSHTIWHLFVLGGSICHFIAIYKL